MSFHTYKRTNSHSQRMLQASCRCLPKAPEAEGLLGSETISCPWRLAKRNAMLPCPELDLKSECCCCVGQDPDVMLDERTASDVGNTIPFGAAVQPVGLSWSHSLPAPHGCRDTQSILAPCGWCELSSASCLPALLVTLSRYFFGASFSYCNHGTISISIGKARPNTFDEKTIPKQLRNFCTAPADSLDRKMERDSSWGDRRRLTESVKEF